MQKPLGSQGGEKRDAQSFGGARPPKAQPSQNGPSKKNKKSKGKGKGGGGGAKSKVSGDKLRMPKELIGFKGVTDKGERICFSYNIGCCSTGRDCGNGLHVCMKCRSSEGGSCRGARKCTK